MMTPGCTVAVRLTASSSRMASISRRQSTTPPSDGTAPPLRLVPAPRGKIGRRWRAATLTTRETSSVERGNTTADGLPRSVSAAASKP